MKHHPARENLVRDLTMIARAMNPRLRVIQKYYVPGREIGIEHLRQGHYIGGDEKKGFTISEMDISLPDQRLKLFAKEGGLIGELKILEKR